jgi:RAB6-interacting golgin
LCFHRKKQTTAEASRLQQIQYELQKLDVLLSNDVSILRDQIEVASREFMEAQWVTLSGH